MMKPRYAAAILGLILLILSSIILAQQPPAPHNVVGRVLHNGSLEGAVNGYPVRVNNTASNQITNTQVFAPSIPQFAGSYALTIDGRDGYTIVVTSWNLTHYGKNTTTLLPTTTTAIVVLDTVRPSELNVSIIIPQNNEERNSTDTFNATANITLIGGTPGTSCQATISFQNESIISITSGETNQHNLGNLGAGDNILTSWNLSGISGGSTNITVSGSCVSDDENFDNVNVDSVSNITILDTSPPSIVLVNPESDHFTNQSSILFFYNATDPSNISECSLFIDGELNSTNTSIVVSGIETNFSLTGMNEGFYTWLVSCADNTQLSNIGNSSARNFTVDFELLDINSVAPKNQFVFRTKEQEFIYNVTDNFAIANCSILIDDQVVSTNYTPQNGTNNSFIVSNPIGNYTWAVSCTDNATNSKLTEIRNFSVSLADLFVNLTSIYLDPGTPIENQNVSINATILNIGTESAENFNISFYLGNPDGGGVQLNQNITASIPASGQYLAETNWTAFFGSHTFFVSLDTPLSENGSVVENNESNNRANTSIVISSWHIYYGDIFGFAALQDLDDDTLRVWLNITDKAGTILVTDSDSSLDFSDLQALGRNTTNVESNNDKIEADIALGLDQLSDSINLTFISGEIKNLTIFSKPINFSPSINTTSSQSFQTNILWDTGDANNGEYNGTQDLIFASQLNASSPGEFGTYDFEIRIPAPLRDLVQGDSKLNFYIELT